MGGAVAAAAEGGEAAAAAAEGGEAAAAAAEGGEAAAEGGEAAAEGGEAAAEGGEAAAEGGEAAAEGGEAAAEGGEAAAEGGGAAEGGDPPPNQDVVDDDPASNLQVEEQQEEVGNVVEESNKIPAEDKVTTWKDVAKSVWGVAQEVIDVAFKVGNMIFLAQMMASMEKGDKAGANAAGGKAGLTPDQVLQFNESVQVWVNLPLGQKWQRLANLMTNVQFTSAQQIYLINWLYQAFVTIDANTKWSWPVSAELALVKALAAETPDAKMYTYMETYVYNQDMPPFDVGLNCVLMALSMKYPSKSS